MVDNLLYDHGCWRKEKTCNTQETNKTFRVYNVLFDKYEIDYVVKYMRGKSWRYLDKLMKERGID